MLVPSQAQRSRQWGGEDKGGADKGASGCKEIAPLHARVWRARQSVRVIQPARARDESSAATRTACWRGSSRDTCAESPAPLPIDCTQIVPHVRPCCAAQLIDRLVGHSCLVGLCGIQTAKSTPDKQAGSCLVGLGKVKKQPHQDQKQPAQGYCAALQQNAQGRHRPLRKKQTSSQINKRVYHHCDEHSHNARSNHAKSSRDTQSTKKKQKTKTHSGLM